MRYITEFDLQTYDHFKSVTSWPSGFAENTVSVYNLLYFPGNIDDLPSWLANFMYMLTTLLKLE